MFFCLSWKQYLLGCSGFFIGYTECLKVLGVAKVNVTKPTDFWVFITECSFKGVKLLVEEFKVSVCSFENKDYIVQYC